MKRLLIISIFSLMQFLCFSQTDLIDTSVFKNGIFKHLQDCQKFYNSEANMKTFKRLRKSYQFDKGLNVRMIIRTVGPDSSLAVLSYNKENKLITRKNYVWGNHDTLYEFSKVLYLYNTKGFNEKTVALTFNDKTKMYDTLFVNSFTYNSKGQKERENIRNVENSFFTFTGFIRITGAKYFKYDEKGRLKEIQRIATHGVNSEIRDSGMDYSIFYSYSGDSLYTETQIGSLDDLYHNSFFEQSYFKNKNGKTTKTIQTDIQTVEIRFINGKYIPDAQSKTARVDSTTTFYQYDKLGRIEKCLHIHHSEDKPSGEKREEQYYESFIYKDNKSYKLPIEEYIDGQE
jgi:hypothetical protein